MRTRVVAVAAVSLFLVACAYVGYVNELLNGALPTAHRVILLGGFLVGAGLAARYLMEAAQRRSNGKVRKRPL